MCDSYDTGFIYKLPMDKYKILYQQLSLKQYEPMNLQSIGDILNSLDARKANAVLNIMAQDPHYSESSFEQTENGVAFYLEKLTSAQMHVLHHLSIMLLSIK